MFAKAFCLYGNLCRLLLGDLYHNVGNAYNQQSTAVYELLYLLYIEHVVQAVLKITLEGDLLNFVCDKVLPFIRDSRCLYLWKGYLTRLWTGELYPGTLICLCFHHRSLQKRLVLWFRQNLFEFATICQNTSILRPHQAAIHLLLPNVGEWLVCQITGERSLAVQGLDSFADEQSCFK